MQVEQLSIFLEYFNDSLSVIDMNISNLQKNKYLLVSRCTRVTFFRPLCTSFQAFKYFSLVSQGICLHTEFPSILSKFGVSAATV